MKNLHIYIFIGFYFSVGGNFIADVLKLKLQKNKESSLSTTDSKLWMNFIEKRLEAMKYMNSYLEFYRINFGQSLFKKLPANCEQMILKENEGVQVSIYGKICGSSESGIEESAESIFCPRYRQTLLHEFCLRTTHKGMSIVREAIYNDFIRGFLCSNILFNDKFIQLISYYICPIKIL